jgi:hypothetical protein
MTRPQLFQQLRITLSLQLSKQIVLIPICMLLAFCLLNLVEPKLITLSYSLDMEQTPQLVFLFGSLKIPVVLHGVNLDT